MGGSFKTPGVKNIEKAYSRAGASNNHTPGHASKLGSQEQGSAGGYEGQGVGSSKFGENYQGSRREVSDKQELVVCRGRC